MNVTTKLKSKNNKADDNKSSKDALTLTFENNQLATQLFGQFDEHLAIVEKMLGIEKHSKEADSDEVLGLTSLISFIKKAKSFKIKY